MELSASVTKKGVEKLSAEKNLGNAETDKIPTITITKTNSMSVNPFWLTL